MQGTGLSTLGVGLGLIISMATVHVLKGLLPSAFGSGIENDFSAVIVASIVVMITGGTLATGVFPVIATMTTDLQSALRARDAAVTRLTGRRGLIVAQIAFACVLVHGATLMDKLFAKRSVSRWDFAPRAW